MQANNHQQGEKGVTFMFWGGGVGGGGMYGMDNVQALACPYCGEQTKRQPIIKEAIVPLGGKSIKLSVLIMNYTCKYVRKYNTLPFFIKTRILFFFYGEDAGILCLSDEKKVTRKQSFHQSTDKGISVRQPDKTVFLCFV